MSKNEKPDVVWQIWDPCHCGRYGPHCFDSPERFKILSSRVGVHLCEFLKPLDDVFWENLNTKTLDHIATIRSFCPFGLRIGVHDWELIHVHPISLFVHPPQALSSSCLAVYPPSALGAVGSRLSNWDRKSRKRKLELKYPRYILTAAELVQISKNIEQFVSEGNELVGDSCTRTQFCARGALGDSEVALGAAPGPPYGLGNPFKILVLKSLVPKGGVRAVKGGVRVSTPS